MTAQDLYRIRDFVPDFDAIAAEFTERSAALAARTRVVADLRYGEKPREVLDVILPERPIAGAPPHVFVHGGYWRSGEKHNYHLVAAPVLAAGGVAAFVEYDLMPHARLEVLVDQVRRAVVWLQAHCPDFGADPARLTVSGHSAGAHLASYLAASGPEEDRPPALPNIQGLFLLSGIYDLSGIPGSFLRDEAQMTEAEAAAWSPHLSSHNSLRRIIAYGEQETAPFLEQACQLHRLLVSSSGNADLISAPGLNHMSVVLDLADPEGFLGKRLHDLVAAPSPSATGDVAADAIM
ncbi:alpha/beta hydrolase [Rhizobium sp. LCM 4573]|uniref:alpha/beta hydrolase n=1 Tax=Rhizobium sp. LCM 4573 TaxID=1848291 RepID=UPI0008D93EAE|nr:alpha/beta hydrolase [Rhizobium sp. LCM 4573]OHV82888.1 lipase [Rhizobium sp. LCM 4573]